MGSQTGREFLHSIAIEHNMESDFHQMNESRTCFGRALQSAIPPSIYDFVHHTISSSLHPQQRATLTLCCRPAFVTAETNIRSGHCLNKGRVMNALRWRQITSESAKTNTIAESSGNLNRRGRICQFHDRRLDEWFESPRPGARSESADQELRAEYAVEFDAFGCSTVELCVECHRTAVPKEMVAWMQHRQP